MFKSLFGLGPATTNIATLNFVLGSAADLTRVSRKTFEMSLLAAAAAGVAVRLSPTAPEEDKAIARSLLEQAMKMQEFHLSVNIVTDKGGFSLDRLQCLAYLLCVEHQMKTFSPHNKERLYSWLQMELSSPHRWKPAAAKTVSIQSPFPVLAVSARISQRHAPFLTFHPRLLSRFPSDMESAVFEFLKVFPAFLSETVAPSALDYARDGLSSLLLHWQHYGLPSLGSRTPRLPFLLKWQQ